MPELIGRQPDAIIACVGGGSNAMGPFHPYIPETSVRLIGVEAGGRGARDRQARGHAVRRHARRAARQPHLPAAGRERPDHRDALDLRRARLSRRGSRARLAQGQRPRRVRAVTDDEALQAFHTLCRLEGIIPALESSHALAYAMKIAPRMAKDKVLLVNLSGRGDKDMHTVAAKSGIELGHHALKVIAPAHECFRLQLPFVMSRIAPRSKHYRRRAARR
jgi:tryptophan synthase beta chain